MSNPKFEIIFTKNQKTFTATTIYDGKAYTKSYDETDDESRNKNLRGGCLNACWARIAIEECKHLGYKDNSPEAIKVWKEVRETTKIIDNYGNSKAKEGN